MSSHQLVPVALIVAVAGTLAAVLLFDLNIISLGWMISAAVAVLLSLVAILLVRRALSPGDYSSQEAVSGRELPGLQLMEDNTSPARWVERDLEEWLGAGSVASMVPGGFEGHARLLHPAVRWWDGGEALVTWAEVARWSGKPLHPTSSLEDLATRPDGSEWWEAVADEHTRAGGPEIGMLPEELCEPLVRILEDFTSTPERCWFCIREGFVDLRSSPGPPRVRIGQRGYVLYAGPVAALPSLVHLLSDSPNLWWPDDRAWFVGTDIENDSTHIGGSRECIQRLLDAEDLEVMPASRTDPKYGDPFVPT